ncbi:hypothetical protein W97_02846 [Coniosporium apollinis CBS 100218]|uniref:RING-type E3 ubiquitin transferase n=1 Tax=Coniosporium apollinis (strain CBS 100218) TaxID=1168221 RepID=R7YP55_CONA1|nr:uncharacterized protein W97_02846 [Coniosporium apollinis CBS 100218]EON63618.1 hypothetical protein W97_02846 [Coniosporium apollinis CBS 100218]
MSRPGENRELVYCHQCENEWYRDEHGLVPCPECQGEFTEIIEPDHDPREDNGPSLDDLLPHPPHPHPFHDHNPWPDAPDPDESDLSGFQLRQTGPNTVSITGTFIRTGTPQELFGSRQAPGFGDPLSQNFATMLQGIVGGNANINVRTRSPRPGEDDNRDRSQQGRGDRPDSPNSRRWTYSPGARLHPRDANHPQPHLEPVDDLHRVLGNLFQGLAGPPPGQPAQDPHNPDQRSQQPVNPLAALFAQLLNPGLAQHGDAVYTQEALDRVISQLMEQNQTGNAPGPAPESAIKSLPKRKVTPEDMGAEGRADCSICMDEVNIGELVTQLPCRHWFHEQCVTMWLSEHDTCPHCRKSIVTGKEAQAQPPGARTPQPNQQRPRAGENYDRMQQMPGAFVRSLPQGPKTVRVYAINTAVTAKESVEQSEREQWEQCSDAGARRAA